MDVFQGCSDYFVQSLAILKVFCMIFGHLCHQLGEARDGELSVCVDDHDTCLAATKAGWNDSPSCEKVEKMCLAAA